MAKGKYKSNNAKGRYLSKNGNPTSGAKMGFSDGKFWVNGWNASKSRGIVKFSGFENKRSKKYEGKQNKKKHIMLFVEVFYERTGSTVVEYIDVCLSEGTAVFKKMNMFMDCSVDMGGSWTGIKKKMK